MISKPLITIGITAYNAEKTISRAIDSCLNQDYSEIEILIVDDFSSDNTYKEIEKYSGQVKYIRHQANQGVASARNTILKLAKGDYIAFLDDDDENMPERIRYQFETLSKFNGPALCYASRIQIFSNGVKRLEPGLKHAKDGRIVLKDLLRWVFFGRFQSKLIGSAGTGTLLAAKNVLKDLEGFDLNFRRAEDMDLLVRAFENGIKILSTDRVLLKQHISFSEDKSPGKEFEAYKKLADKYKGQLLENQLFRPVMNWLNFKNAVQTKRFLKAFLDMMKLCISSPRVVLILFKLSFSNSNIIFKRLIGNNKNG